MLDETVRRAARFLESLPERPVAASSRAGDLAAALGGALPEKGLPASEVLSRLDEIGGQGTVASAGPRYFGFVTGGVLPAPLAANWLAAAWDQNAFSETSSPVGAAVERVATRWLLEALDLPADSGTAFVTGATMANFAALAADRRAVLLAHGHDVDRHGLHAAPEVAVVAGEQAHATLFKALGMLGLGRDRVVRVPVDGEGRMRVDALPDLDGPAIVCTQAGNVNTGAFDPIGAICEAVRAGDVRVHVDGAFGLWARISPEFAALAEGIERADSWAADAHKWLNVPYDSGLAIVRDAGALRGAMSVQADYLPDPANREPFEFTPETSRRMRGVEVWAALASLGRDGLAALVERNCRQARRFAAGLQDAGFEILNDVVLNQALVAFGDDRTTERVIRGVQRDGTCWCGGTRWNGRAAMRISVSSWATADDDVERSLAAIIRVANQVRGQA
ncbi:MAG: aspartate aminotransferase family protein [Alphaproteobacteria bacterium]|nr:aspartate aminotransferase family protein [Alphaproteobacteria bacterium]